MARLFRAATGSGENAWGKHETDRPSFDAKQCFALGLHHLTHSKAAAMSPLTCFKAYDIRGIVGVDLTPEIATSIGRAFAQTLRAKRVVIGRDCRLSSDSLMQATAKGVMDGGGRCA